AMAIQRSSEALDNRIQVFIKAKATAIHPSVHSRFRKAVLSTMDRPREGGHDAKLEMGPIVFPDVYPLYALADIRGSSTLRATSIQADLLTQLRLARDVVEAAYAAKALPALDELRYRLHKNRQTIEAGAPARDGVSV